MKTDRNHSTKNTFSRNRYVQKKPIFTIHHLGNLVTNKFTYNSYTNAKHMDTDSQTLHRELSAIVFSLVFSHYVTDRNKIVDTAANNPRKEKFSQILLHD